MWECRYSLGDVRHDLRAFQALVPRDLNWEFVPLEVVTSREILPFEHFSPLAVDLGPVKLCSSAGCECDVSRRVSRWVNDSDDVLILWVAVRHRRIGSRLLHLQLCSNERLELLWNSHELRDIRFVLKNNSTFALSVRELNHVVLFRS